jgi:hypothetical protein
MKNAICNYMYYNVFCEKIPHDFVNKIVSCIIYPIFSDRSAPKRSPSVFNPSNAFCRNTS